MKGRVAMFILNNKADIWQEDLKNLREIQEEEISWGRIKAYLRENYLFEAYYGGEAKELYELKMGKLSIDDCTTKFWE